MTGIILLERSLPLEWHVLEASDRSSQSVQNSLILGLLDTLEEPVSSPENEQSGEWKRIDTKLNIILQLLSQMLQGRQSLVTPVPTRFHSDTLAWQEAQPPAIGSQLLISLYPEPSIPLAMHFEATVLSFHDHWVEVDMHGLTEDERAMWSRWVFRQHRRQVAHTRAVLTPQG